MKKLFLSLTLCLIAFAEHTSVLAMEMPSLIIHNSSGKPITVEYRRISNFDTGKADEENIGVGKQATIEQRPTNNINTMTIKALVDPTVEPIPIDAIDIIKLLQAPTSTINVSSGPQGELNYTVITPEEREKQAKRSELESFSQEKDQSSASMQKQAMQMTPIGSSSKIVLQKITNKQEGPKMFIKEVKGIKPQLRGNRLEIKKIITEAGLQTIAIINSADPLGISVGRNVNLRSGTVFIPPFPGLSPSYTLERPISLIQGDAPKLVIIIGNTAFYQLEMNDMEELRDRLGNDLILKVYKNNQISFEADQEGSH